MPATAEQIEAKAKQKAEDKAKYKADVDRIREQLKTVDVKQVVGKRDAARRKRADERRKYLDSAHKQIKEHEKLSSAQHALIAARRRRRDGETPFVSRRARGACGEGEGAQRLRRAARLAPTRLASGDASATARAAGASIQKACAP